MLVSFDALEVVVGAHAWCGGSRVHLFWASACVAGAPHSQLVMKSRWWCPALTRGCKGLCGVLQTVSVCQKTLVCARMVVCNSWVARAWPESTTRCRCDVNVEASPSKPPQKDHCNIFTCEKARSTRPISDSRAVCVCVCE
jgi:hypothetical protein